MSVRRLTVDLCASWTGCAGS